MLPSQIAASIKGQVTRVLATGQRFKRFDQVRQRHFWSTYRFTPDINGYVESGDFQFFQTPAGQQGQGFPFQLTPLETNWVGANRVPDNQNLIITEFGLSCQMAVIEREAISDDPNKPIFQVANFFSYPGQENQILDNAVLNIVYLTNEVSLGLATDFSQASGPMLGFYAPGMPQTYPLPGVDDGNPDTPDDFVGQQAPTDPYRTLVTNGFAAPALRRKMKVPILLQHGETFRMSLVIPAGRGAFMWPAVASVQPDEIQNVAALDVRLEFWATESFVE